MGDEHDDTVPFDEQDRMDESFDELRLRAADLRMRGEEGRQLVEKLHTGNPDLDALLRETIGGLIDRSDQIADNTDETVNHFHPLYRRDKEAGLAGPPPATDDTP